MFADLAAASRAVSGTQARGAKVTSLAAVLRTAGPDELAVAVDHLSGELPQRRTGIGHRALTDLPAPAAEPSLTVLEVHAAMDALATVSGPGSVGRRRALLVDLYGRATADEQRLLTGLLSGELRQGAQQGVVTDAVAKTYDLPLADVRTAVMLSGSLPTVAVAAQAEGAAGLAAFRLQLGRPLAPMLAQPGSDLAAALARTPSAAVEWKLDGIRVQVHRSDEEVHVFTRSLDDITHRVPELVEVVRSLPAHALVLDGEALALRPDGSPLPFQVTASRAASSSEHVATLTPYFFDLLHRDGVDLLGRPLGERIAALDEVVPSRWRAPRAVSSAGADLDAFAADALARGHEGVVVKDLTAPYAAGRRGGGWLKVKPVHTFDLVVLAVEWGSGRRTGKLSNLHLGARSGDGFVMLGKTFKGLTDELLSWQTAELLARETSRDAHTVFVRPELVVEIAIDGVQTSSRYPGGIALRFARVVRYRPDKTAEQASTLQEVRSLHTPV